jgi:probable O-glycosylation ligase (exosortase A-associated)
MVMPQQWYDRMATIETYQQDDSALGRINAWRMAFNLAKDRPLGAGFESFRREMFARYAPDPGNVHDAHSIYFEVLGEQGFVGLALFLVLAVMTWFSASWIARHAKADGSTAWMADLARMIQVSLVGYATAGAFLGLAYFDYYYTLVAIVVLCKVHLEKHLATQAREQAAPQPVPTNVPTLVARPGKWGPRTPAEEAANMAKSPSPHG